MSKVRRFSLICCLFFMATWSQVYGVTNCQNDEVPIIIIKDSTYTGADRGNSISPFINGHMLTVVFTENLGQVSVEVSTAAGVSIEYLSILTPNGLQTYILNAGDYIVIFTLANGEEYYGEFTVTDL